jgi:hypothetical protein
VSTFFQALAGCFPNIVPRTARIIAAIASAVAVG